MLPGLAAEKVKKLIDWIYEFGKVSSTPPEGTEDVCR